MAIVEIRVPDIGSTGSLEIIEILVAEGERVEQESPLLTLESDKATMEIPSPVSGEIKEIKVAVGDAVSQGDLIFLVEVAEVSVSVASNTDSAQVSEVAEPSTKEVEVSSVDTVNETSSEYEKPLAEQPSSRKQIKDAPTNSAFPPYASPSIRLMARELAVPLDKVNGSGVKGRITKDDIQAYVKSVMTKSVSGAVSASGGFAFPAMPSVDFSKFGTVERQPLTRIQKISSANLHRNWVNIPHVTNHDDADITGLEQFRRDINAEQKRTGSDTKITMVALLIKSVVAALKQFPRFNASLDGEELILKKYFHIGFAADTPNGLVVPVLRNADEKGLLQIAKEVSELSEKARNGKLKVEEMSGGCFSISSLGGIGGSYFTPIINAPEIAILGVGKAKHQMIWSEEAGAAEPRLIMPLSLSWDHRAIDGAMAGRFNAYLCKVLADYRRVML